jgi:hypothetical protein
VAYNAALPEGFLAVLSTGPRYGSGAMRKRPLIREDVAPDIPLRLGIAAALAFPDGSMTAARLRRDLNKLNDSASISAISTR